MSIELDLNKLDRKAVTIPEAAKMIAVSPLTVRRAIKRGDLKAIRTSPNGVYRIPIVELDKFLAMLQ